MEITWLIIVQSGLCTNHCTQIKFKVSMMIQLPSSFYGVETEAQRLRSARVTSWEVAETRFEPLHLCSCPSEAQAGRSGPLYIT